MARSADDFVATLAMHGVDRLFCVPGESYLPLLDALAVSTIKSVTCRHEGGAALMAVADAKLTGRAALCLVSRGPGATNAAIGVHLAEQDGVPLVLVIGQVRRSEIGRRAFQEVDYASSLGGLAKATLCVGEAASLAEDLARAIAIAEAPTPGPVLLVVPEDVFEQTGAGPVGPPPSPVAIASGAEHVTAVADLIGHAERPLLIAGPRLRGSAGRAALKAAAELFGMPVATAFKQQHLFPNLHPLYAGHLGFKLPAAIVEEYDRADLIVAIGTRLGDVTSQGYRLPSLAAPRQRLVHVSDDPAVIGRVHRSDMGLVADPIGFLTALAAMPGEPVSIERAAWAERLHRLMRPVPWQSGEARVLEVGAVVNTLARRLRDDAILLTDAGNFSGWVHRHFPFGERHELIGAIGGAMGLAVPGAVAASLRYPDRQVIAFVGDGGFQMTGAELSTARQYGATPKIIVCNNSSFGTIRMHQERSFPGRIAATDLHNPDFAAIGRAHGFHALTVGDCDDAEDAVTEMLAHPGPVLVEVRTNAEHIAPGVTIAAIRAAAAAR
jgi:acetolactate synthase-1/2/3 large subunit